MVYLEGVPKKRERLLHLARVHETAIVHQNAVLGRGVEVGPYSIIGEGVKIGDDTEIGSHVVMDGHTELGECNKIYTGVIIGYPPQHLHCTAEETKVIIGSHNTIREYVTIHRGTEEDKGETRIGHHNYMMAYSHIAHDCIVGDNVIMANGASLGGHVIVGDRAFLSGFVMIHQFCRIGSMAMIGGCSKVVKDVPPYMLVDGHPASVRGINLVGLRRNGLSPETRREIKRAYRILYRSQLNVSDAMERMEQELDNSHYIEAFLRFLRNAERGICK